MTNQDFGTLAYTKNPKTSRRTTFQDELQSAVSARARKPKTDQYSYSDDLGEDKDDFLNQLLKSRKNRTGALKVRKSKSKINNFEISDDEDKHSRTKRVSFLKTQRISSPLGDTTASGSRETEPPDSSDYNDSQQFKNSDVESADPQITRESSSKSLSYQTSDDTLLDMPLPLLSDSSVTDTPGPEERSNSGLEESSQTPPATDLGHESSADSAAEREPPRPKPRQRTVGLSLHTTEKIAEDAEEDAEEKVAEDAEEDADEKVAEDAEEDAEEKVAEDAEEDAEEKVAEDAEEDAEEKVAEDAESQALSRPQTSTASIPLSTDASSNITWTDGDHAVSWSLSKSSSSKSQRSQLLTKSTVDSGSRDGFISDGSKDQEGKYTSLDQFHQDRGDQSYQLSHVHQRSFDTRTSSSHSKTTQRSQSLPSMKVESKYLGTLKVLDRKVSQQESQPQAADSLRAAVYQEWLQKKKVKSRENMKLKKKEEILKEKKKREQEAKKEEAVASYEAWKEKKLESFKAKAKEKQDIIRKEQRVIEEKEEKQQSAKQVFEKWKCEHDQMLKKKYRGQREAENTQKFQKQEKEEERRRESKSAFSNWREKKTDVLQEQIMKERKEIKNKAEEECYMKEERDKMALEMYENWLVRKDLEQKRQREERRIQAILRDSPPPPWSPPNKTIPFRKK